MQTDPDAAEADGPPVPGRPPRRPGPGGRVPAADARRAGRPAALAGIDTVVERAGAPGPQGAARRGRAARLHPGRQQRPPGARHDARRRRGRRPRRRRPSSSTAPSTSSTPTSRASSTPSRAGACPGLTRAGAGGDRIARWNVGGRRCYRLGALNWMRRLPPSSSGLGHHPFKVAARVRIPLGVRIHDSRHWSRGEVWSSRRPVKPEVAGSSPVGTAHPPVVERVGMRGRVAQSAERPPEKRKVTGSTPVSTTERGHGFAPWPRSRPGTSSPAAARWHAGTLRR